MHLRFILAELKYRVKELFRKLREKFIVWCSNKGILFVHYKNSRVDRSTIIVPKKFTDIDLEHYQGTRSFSTFREIFSDVDFYYPKWKEAKIQNSVYTIRNNEHEEFSIHVKYSIEQFLVEYEELCVWCRTSGSIIRFTLPERYDVFRPVDPSTPIEKPEIKEVQVDLSFMREAACIARFGGDHHRYKEALNMACDSIDKKLENDYQMNLKKALGLDTSSK